MGSVGGGQICQPGAASASDDSGSPGGACGELPASPSPLQRPLVAIRGLLSYPSGPQTVHSPDQQARQEPLRLTCLLPSSTAGAGSIAHTAQGPQGLPHCLHLSGPHQGCQAGSYS